jgi:L-ascorbate metabolism protein UlaG (beta-lactamase superfamily)
MNPVTTTLCHIGTATVLIDIGGFRILTDPVLDPPGHAYRSGVGIEEYKRLDAPALPPEGLGKIDLVLVSHDHHGDNLDSAGIELMRSVSTVLTTRPGARRLRKQGITNVQGLAPWESVQVGPVTVHATPARHAPFGLHLLPAVGPVIGFFVEGPLELGPLYVSGDTRWFRGLGAVRDRLGRPGTALLHAGGARLGVGPFSVQFSADADEIRRMLDRIEPVQAIPIHAEGWSHFSEPPEVLQEQLSGRLRWIPRGVPVPLEP